MHKGTSRNWPTLTISTSTTRRQLTKLKAKRALYHSFWPSLVFEDFLLQLN